MKVKALVLDVETRPALVYTFELKETTIRWRQIKEESCIIAWSAKWLNEPINTIKYMDLRNAKYPIVDDSSILRPLHKMMSDADIIVGQNSKEFDVKRLNARFDMNGLKPLTHFKHYDLYLMSRQVAAYTSQKLEYVAEKLNSKYKKLQHKNFPGMTLWLECLAGNIDAWNEMKKYNIHDVLSTEERCNLVRKWAPKAFPDLDATKCGGCGKVNIVKIKCEECGRWGQK
jgi:uncharacterized protein YprB with RNaseH-like and TPR domain